MVGKTIVLHSDGWTCSNIAKLQQEEDYMRDAKGAITSVVVTNTLIVDMSFAVTGTIKTNETVECLMRLDDGKRLLFKGRVSAVTPSGSVHIVIGKELDNNISRINNFLERVKQWQEG